MFTFTFWTQFRHIFGLQGPSIKAPLIGNHLLPKSLQDSVFTAWARLGIRTFADLYLDSSFASFEQLMANFSLLRNHFFFFRYFQVQNFVRCSYKDFPVLPSHLFVLNTVLLSVRSYTLLIILRPDSLKYITQCLRCVIGAVILLQIMLIYSGTLHL